MWWILFFFLTYMQQNQQAWENVDRQGRGEKERERKRETHECRNTFFKGHRNTPQCIKTLLKHYTIAFHLLVSRLYANWSKCKEAAVQPYPAPCAATHGSVSEMEEFGRNTCFREHCQVCRTQQNSESRGTGFN